MYQIPALLSEVELLGPLYDGRQHDAKPFRRGVRQRHGFLGRVETGHAPSLLREVDGIPALSHANVQRRSGRTPLDHLDEKGIGIGVERGLLGGQNSIPSLGFQSPALVLNRPEQSGAVLGRHPARGEIRIVMT